MDEPKLTNPLFLLFLISAGSFCYFVLKMERPTEGNTETWLKAIAVGCGVLGAAITAFFTKQDTLISLSGGIGANTGVQIALRIDYTLNHRGSTGNG